MKKVLLLGAMAAVAMSASAQFTVDPGLQRVLDQKPTKIWGIVLSDQAVERIQKAGVAYEFIGPNGEGGNSALDVWAQGETLAGNETPVIRVDEEEGGCVNFTVEAPDGWSGGGFRIAEPGDDLTGLDMDAHFHFAYTTTSTAPAGMGLTILDGNAEKGWAPAKVSIGETAVDGQPLIGGKITDEWTGVDITLSDLKKLVPAFTLGELNGWTGYTFSFTGGAVKGTSFALDAIYFYTCKELGGAVDVVVDDNAAAEYYTVDGVKVANPEEGQLYIVVKGGKASKVIL